jgi:hypothetical protein
MVTLLKAIYRFNKMLINIPMSLSSEIEKSVLKFIWKYKSLWIAKAIPSKKSNAGGITISDFKLWYRTILTKTAWCWHNRRHEEPWNRIEDPEINQHSYSHQVFTKKPKTHTRIRLAILKKTNNKCWSEYRENGTLLVGALLVGK